MVDAGELTITGDLDDSDLAMAFIRLENDFKNLENQVNQSNASFGLLGSTSAKVLKTFVGLGIAGVTAMTALAIKSPVLAGTMAKIEVETLKLSNTIGRQLRPVFEAIANNLIPSINKAFADNSDTMGDLTDRTVGLVDALSDLVSLDLTGFLEDLEKIVEPGGFKTGTTREETQKALGGFSEFETTVGAISDTGLSDLTFVGVQRKTAQLLISAIVDTVQFALGTNNAKERTFISADGVNR